LIKFVSKSGVTEVEIQQKDFKITIKAEPGNKRKGKDGGDTYLGQPVQMVPAMAAPIQQMQQPQQPAMAPSPAPTGEKDKKEEVATNHITIKAPMIGTFYRSPGPDKGPIVNVGDEITPGKVIC